VLVIADHCGRLGNRLWTFANALAWGMENGCSVLAPGFAEYAAHFPELARHSRTPGWLAPGCLGRRLAATTPASAWKLLFRLNLRLRAWPYLAVPDGEALDLDSAGRPASMRSAPLVFLTGLYSLASVSLRKHSESVRSLFRPTDALRRQAEAVVGAARHTSDVVVGIHVRQGDYRIYCGGVMFYTSEEYADQMRRLQSLWPGRAVAFVVCSDEPQPPEAFAGLDVHWGPGTPVADLHSLALCDDIVGPSSTFSRWASFWGEKPLWRMDWKAEERYHAATVTRCPAVADFAVCSTPSHLVDEGRLRHWHAGVA
jgi:hypothetical protein